MSASSQNKLEWIYRMFDRRTISIKAKNGEARKIAAIDVLTNLPLSIEVSKDMPMENVEVEKSYFASVKVYTYRNIQSVDPGYINFFEAVDVDQPMEDFIKAYSIYPKLIKFELVEVEQI